MSVYFFWFRSVLGTSTLDWLCVIQKKTRVVAFDYNQNVDQSTYILISDLTDRFTSSKYFRESTNFKIRIHVGGCWFFCTLCIRTYLINIKVAAKLKTILSLLKFFAKLKRLVNVSWLIYSDWKFKLIIWSITLLMTLVARVSYFNRILFFCRTIRSGV